LQDLRQIRTKPGQPLSALKGLDSGIMFCTYDLLTAGATPAKPKKGGKPGRPPKAAAAATAATQMYSSAAGYGMAGGSFSSAGSGGLSGGLFGSSSGSFSRSGSGNAGVWDDENQPPPWERPQSPDEDEEWEPTVEEFGESAAVCQLCGTGFTLFVRQMRSGSLLLQTLESHQLSCLAAPVVPCVL
jgi:hypothetical protein